MATIAIDGGQLTGRKLKRKRKKDAKEDMRQLLAQRRFSDHKIARKTMDIVKALVLVGLSAFVGKYAVTGGYDLTWETHQPLVRFAVELLVLAGLAIMYGSVRGLRGKSTSWGTVTFIAGVLSLGAIGVLVAHHMQPQLVDNTMLWHWLVPNDTIRHVFGRDWLEGLFGGLFGVFMGWNTLKKRAKKRWYSKAMDVARLPNLDNEERNVRSWHVWILPALIIALGLPLAYGAWRLELLTGAHAAEIHTWIRMHVPWHVNIPLNNTQTNLVAKAQDSVTAALPMFVIGFASAKWWGRVPAFGVIDEYQEYLALRRIAKKGHRGLHGVLAFWQSTGYQLALIQEMENGNGNPVAYANGRLATYDQGLIIPLKILTYGLVPLIIIGGFFLLYVAKYG